MQILASPIKLVTKQKYDKLIDYLNKLSKAYYEDGESLVSDGVYDSLYREVEEYEKTNTPRKDSPTQRVGHGSKGA